MDFASVYTNCITAKSFRMALLPLYGNSDKDAIEMAMAHSFLTEPNKAKVVRIKNTLKLEEIECSTSCLEDIEAVPIWPSYPIRLLGRLMTKTIYGSKKSIAAVSRCGNAFLSVPYYKPL